MRWASTVPVPGRISNSIHPAEEPVEPETKCGMTGPQVNRRGRFFMKAAIPSFWSAVE